ncbi:hypothetical protein I215_03495 [Galbibacter marinus]|uniref:Alpha/beta hydrolase n=1 Tax=Galbibacter marinus TaxID=555500 RepID=K2Q540_9FLAO|nr:hypothetical protein [Galbibacter marinus]EKF55976.1 hypothetical protein I215_03495 [Galbibacter marinus]
MKLFLLVCILLFPTFIACINTREDRYIFFLHNRFLETHHLNDRHFEFGRTEYREIIHKFENAGFIVLSEKRNGNVNARTYAVKINGQIDSLINQGVHPNNITVIGTSKGGYIAQYVSTLAKNQDLNFVFIASFRESDIRNIPEINFCGNILTIYEKTDPYGVSAIERKNISSCTIVNFKELQLNTGKGHGFIFKALNQWIKPSIDWANGYYKIDTQKK